MIIPNSRLRLLITYQKNRESKLILNENFYICSYLVLLNIHFLSWVQTLKSLQIYFYSLKHKSIPFIYYLMDIPVTVLCSILCQQIEVDFNQVEFSSVCHKLQSVLLSLLSKSNTNPVGGAQWRQYSIAPNSSESYYLAYY